MRSLATLAVAVFVVALAVLALARSDSELHPPYPKAQAVAAALRDGGIRTALRESGWDHARVIPLDRRHWRVSFFNGPRYVADAAVDPAGRVDATEIHSATAHPPGARMLWNPFVLVLLTALFIAAVAVRPLATLRNLDALVVGAGFTTSAVLKDHRLLAAHVYVAATCLAYVAARCLATGLAARVPTQVQAVASLLPDHRMLRVGAGALVVAAVLIVVSSSGMSDVAFAGLAGGTLLDHGISPYGHIPVEVVHGDTYPLLTYVLYMPSAAIAPVRDSFDSLDGALWLNAIALIAAAALFARTGISHVLAWLAFPAVLLAASGGGNDVPAAAFVVGALVFATRTQISIALLTLGGWVKIAPAVALIPWLARLRGAALLRGVAVVVALFSAGIAAMAIVGGFDAIDRAFTALRFQFERGSWFSLWRQLGSPAVQVVLQALTVTAAAVAALIADRDADLSLRRLAALAGAVIALLQLSANSWTYEYLAWLLPFILVALFPPARLRSPQPAPRAP